MDVSRFSDCSILVVGDLMIDEYLWGEVDRISPEAPVPVVSARREEFIPGGAGNVVNNLVALGAGVFPVGVIGTGRNGRRLTELFKKLGLDTDGIFEDADRPTTRKTRVIAGSQHVLRIDHESNQEVSADTFDALLNYLESRIPSVDAVLVSDYDKGTVTRNLLSHIVRMAKIHGKKVIADPKGLDFTKYRGVSLLTPNRKEAGMASGLNLADKATLFDAGRHLIQLAELDNLLITCGKDGMVFFRPGEEPFEIRSQARQVYDVSGAGDTVLALLGLSTAAGATLEEAAACANAAAGIVVGKVGTATLSRQELAGALGVGTDAQPEKLKTMEELASIVSDLKKKGNRIVLTNGCFDLLHAGHVDLLTAAKRIGDKLVVAIDDDDSVARLKGPGRPVIPQRERIRVLNAMDSVDYVVVFSSEQLEALIRTIRPDILAKGNNYTADTVKGRQVVEELGGEVALVPISGGLSSTRIINDIKNS